MASRCRTPEHLYRQLPLLAAEIVCIACSHSTNPQDRQCHQNAQEEQAGDVDMRGITTAGSVGRSKRGMKISSRVWPRVGHTTCSPQDQRAPSDQGCRHLTVQMAMTACGDVGTRRMQNGIYRCTKSHVNSESVGALTCPDHDCAKLHSTPQVGFSGPMHEHGLGSSWQQQSLTSIRNSK